MSQNFSWQTDEDSHWDDPIPGLPPGPRRKRHWQWLLVFAAAALLISTVIYARLQQQIQAATNQAEQDVLAAHQLSQHAAASNDLDLFRSNLSRRDPNWADVQRELITEGLFLDRSAFGLRWWGETGITLTDAAATPTLPITITLTPDLLSAEIVYEQEYLLTGSATPSETIRLQQTAVYRRGGGRWLRADPLDDFWGETEELEQPYLTMLFNQRDQVIATRLAQDLNQQLQVMCETFPDLNCSDDFHLRLLLTRNPERFFTLQDRESVITTEDQLSLPSPTLVGLPVDEAGYQIILKGYAVPLVSLAITRLTGYECCEHGLFFRAFLEKELSVLGLQPWSLTTEQYTQLTLTELPNAVTSYWNLERFDYDGYENLYYFYSLVDFLNHKYPETGLPLWQQGMGGAFTYWGWLGWVLGTVKSQAIFNTEWMQFIQRQAVLADPSIPLPTGQLQLACNTENGPFDVYRYDPRMDEWDIMILETGESRRIINVFQAIPGGYIAEQIVNDQRMIVMLRGGVSAVIASDLISDVIYTTAYPYLRLLSGKTPDNFFHFQSYNNRDGEEPQNWLVNLDDCADGNCQPQLIAGIPIWSPDGQFMLLYDDFYNEVEGNINIHLGDRNAQIISTAGLGQYPFWLDNSHYAYFSYDVGDFEESVLTTDLYIGHINGDPPQAIFTHADLLNLIPQITDLNHAIMISGNARPGEYQEVSILVIPWNDSVSDYWVYVITLQGDEGWQGIEASYVTWSGSSPVIPSYSPDGRFQLFSNAYSSQTGPVVTIRDLTDGTEQVIRAVVTDSFFSSFPEWTEDGRWFIYVSNDEIIFVNPYEKAEWRVPHALNQCNQMYYAPGEE